MTFYRKGARWRLFSLIVPLISGLAFSSQAISGSKMPDPVGDTCEAGYFDETARVRSIHDGDTVRLDDGRKIRLIGINSPEVARGDRPAQAFANKARDQLKRLIASHKNEVKLVYGKQRHDRYKRTLAHLFSPDSENLQATLLQSGLATAYTYPPNLAYTDCYLQAEQAARCKSRGIWSDSDYAVKSSTALDPDTDGFSIVSGRVERVSESRKGFRLFLEGGLMLDVPAADLPGFNKGELKSLANKKITVRGWLHPGKRGKKGAKFYMRLRHPSAITPAATTDNIIKC